MTALKIRTPLVYPAVETNNADPMAAAMNADNAQKISNVPMMVFVCPHRANRNATIDNAARMAVVVSAAHATKAKYAM